MKTIEEILKALGMEIPADKKADFDAAVAENYKPADEFAKQEGQIAALNDKLKTAEDGLKAFDGVDVADLQGKVKQLTDDLAAKDSEYQNKIADMEFDSLITGAVTAAKGRNAKAICALLDVDALKASHNQQADITAALDALKQDNGYLFESTQTPPPYAAGTGTQPITTKFAPEVNAIRAAAGLKTE